MSEKLENKWREEFEKSHKEYFNDSESFIYGEYEEPIYNTEGLQESWLHYLEARKKAQEEIDELKEELKREREAIDIISIIHSNDDIGLDRASAMLIVAEETQKQRRIEL